MRKYLLALGAFLALGISVLAVTSVTHASTFKSGTNVTTTQGEVIDSSLFVAGSTIDIAGVVNGDVYCAGQTVTISGAVNGDVLCAAQSLDISGKVAGDVRLAGQTVTINNEVLGNATVVSQAFTLGSNGKVGRDLTLGSANATLNGSVGRDVAVAGSHVTVAGDVGRNITGPVEFLTLGSNSRVGGGIYYTSNNELTKNDGAQVAGQVNRSVPTESQSGNGFKFFGLALLWLGISALSALFVALVLALVIPGVLHSTTTRAIDKPFIAPLVGVAASLFVPFVLVLLFATVVGIPLAIIGALSWVVILMLSGPFTAYLVGRLILQNSTQPILIMLVGTLALLVLYFIPIIGFFAVILALWYGAGMILLELFRRYPRPVYEVSETSAARRKR